MISYPPTSRKMTVDYIQEHENEIWHLLAVRIVQHHPIVGPRQIYGDSQGMQE